MKGTKGSRRFSAENPTTNWGLTLIVPVLLLLNVGGMGVINLPGGPFLGPVPGGPMLDFFGGTGTRTWGIRLSQTGHHVSRRSSSGSSIVWDWLLFSFFFFGEEGCSAKGGWMPLWRGGRGHPTEGGKRVKGKR